MLAPLAAGLGGRRSNQVSCGSLVQERVNRVPSAVHVARDGPVGVDGLRLEARSRSRGVQDGVEVDEIGTIVKETVLQIEGWRRTYLVQDPDPRL